MFILKQLFLFFTILNPVNKNYWENCGSKTDYLQDIKITYKPHTIHKETNLTIDILGTLTDILTDGEINYEIFFDHIPLYKDTIDICSLFKCPLEKG